MAGGGYSAVVAGVIAASTFTGCIRDARDIHAANSQPAPVPSGVVACSWGLCSLLGPRAHNPGVYGGDLGFTADDPAHAGSDGRLAILFGDTWARPVDACQYPVTKSDDLLASLPRKRPESLLAGSPTGAERSACKTLNYSLASPNDVTSWPRLRLFGAASALC